MSSSVALAAAEPAALPYRMLAIGGSAGAIPVLIRILSDLPAGLPVPIVVVQHLPAHWPSALPTILGYRAAMPCTWAEDGERPVAGIVHVAPPGRNLVLAADGRFRHVDGAKPKMGWPSVDLFFHSMAETIGRQSIGVILSGMLYDGADGVSAVRRAGGATMAQHPATASSREMPDAAVDLGRADLSRTPGQIAEAVSILVEHGVE